jgi:hypothetical protein
MAALQHLSGHLWNAALLVVSASVALAADRVTAAPARAVPSSGAGDDISAYVGRVALDSGRPLFQMPLWLDPFDRPGATVENPAVASLADVPTVPSSSARGRGLTAILIADERRVAVIDDATVSVGDVLRDGARVSSIQPDRVWIVEKDGRWRMLTLTNRGR